MSSTTALFRTDGRLSHESRYMYMEVCGTSAADGKAIFELGGTKVEATVKFDPRSYNFGNFKIRIFYEYLM
ncbi:MAG: hypothetical protein MHPSP_003278 [Paramarteilia canceri]